MPPVTTLTYGPESRKMNARGSRRKIKVTYGTLQNEPDVGNQCLGSPVVTGKLRLVGCGTGRLQGRKAHRQDVPVFIIFARIIVVASNPQNRSRPIHHVVQLLNPYFGTLNIIGQSGLGFAKIAKLQGTK